MRDIPITRARRELAKLVRLASEGRSIAITRNGLPVAILEPFTTRELVDRDAPFYAAFGVEILERGMDDFKLIRDQAMAILSPDPLGAVAQDKLVAKMKELYAEGASIE